MKRVLTYLKWLGFLALCCWGSTAFAQGQDIFTPPAIADGTDKSVFLLGQVFGSVGGVLHGFGSQILGTMFGVFNTAALGLGGIIALYTVIVSTLNTAQEGEFLGRKWSSMWIPFRTAMGIGLLLPKASGYSVLQVFIMWVVLQGVGVADTTWNKTVDYIQHSGGVLGPQQNEKDYKVILETATSMLSQQICAVGLQRAYNKTHTGSESVTLRASYPTLSQSKYSSTLPGKHSLPLLNPYNLQAGSCGGFSWVQHTGTAAAKLDAAVLDASWQLLADLRLIAGQVVDDNGQNVDKDAVALNLANAVLDFQNIMSPAVIERNNATSEKLNQALEDSKKDGWILAGTYYNTITGISKQRVAVSGFLPKMTTGSHKGGDIGSEWQRIQSLMDVASNEDIQKKAADILHADTSGQMAKGLNSLRYIDKGEGGARALIGVFTMGMGNIFQFWKDAFHIGNKQAHLDPIVAVTSLGNRIVQAVGTMWVTISIVVYALGLISGVMSCTNPLFWGFEAFLLWFIPISTLIMSLLFTVGSVMAYYVPLVPYMLFLFGAMGWVIGVVESMIAAPLVALGFTHPEGHEAYGRAEPAVMLLMNIFLRPSLMLVGFIVGILLSYLGLELLNLGFSQVVNSMSTDGAGGFAYLFRSIAVIIIYTSLVILIINRAFALIHEVPDKVMRWISGGEQAQLGSGAPDLGQVQGAVSGGASGFGHAAGQGHSAASQENAKRGMKKGGEVRGKLKSQFGGGGGPPALPEAGEGGGAGDGDAAGGGDGDGAGGGDAGGGDAGGGDAGGGDGAGGGNNINWWPGV